MTLELVSRLAEQRHVFCRRTLRRFRVAPHSKSQKEAMTPFDSAVKFFHERAKSSDRNRSNAHHLLIAESSCTESGMMHAFHQGSGSSDQA
jgi:hypothetical protein